MRVEELLLNLNHYFPQIFQAHGSSTGMSIFNLLLTTNKQFVTYSSEYIQQQQTNQLQGEWECRNARIFREWHPDIWLKMKIS
jgi:hypothetical protein